MIPTPLPLSTPEGEGVWSLRFTPVSLSEKEGGKYGDEERMERLLIFD